MIYFVTEMFETARPLVERYSLRKIIGIRAYDIFAGDRAMLSISGAGAAGCAACAARLLTLYPPGENDIFAGLCFVPGGSSATRIANVLTDRSFRPEKRFYPDMLYKHPFEETEMDNNGVFMYEAALQLMRAHRLCIFELETDIAGVAPTYEHDNITHICEWLEGVENIQDTESFCFSADEENMLRSLEKNLSLTAAMSGELRELARKYKVRNDELLSGLEPFAAIHTEKRAGKGIYSKICEQLKTL